MLRGLQDGESALVSSQALQGVAVTQVQPTQLTQLIRTSLTVTLNTSLCENLRQVNTIAVIVQSGSDRAVHEPDPRVWGVVGALQPCSRVEVLH